MHKKITYQKHQIIFFLLCSTILFSSFQGFTFAGNEKVELPEATIRYPFYPNTDVSENDCLGKYLASTKDIPEGTVVAKFEGSATEDTTHRHAKWIGKDLFNNDKYIIVESSAVYINHSCDPNCSVRNKTWEIVTKRAVKKGEALTISYNDKKDFPPHLTWDPAWNFSCCCRAPNCQKEITGWKN